MRSYFWRGHVMKCKTDANHQRAGRKAEIMAYCEEILGIVIKL